MRRKNGYTLTEILVVILLLAVVGGIIIFKINPILNKNKEKAYDRYVTYVKSSAETFANLNLERVSELYENKSFTYITAGELIDQGFLDEKTTNPYTNQRIGRDELIKISLSTETGNLTVIYPAVEENKEVFLSSVVLSTNVDTSVDCMDGIGTYTLALSDETGKLILDKDTLINEYNLSCKLPDSFTKTAGNMNNEIGSSSQVGTYEINYYWISKSGTRGTGKRFLKVVPDTITVDYNVDLIEGERWPVNPWTNSTCVGKISTVDGKTVCSKEVLVGYNYNTLSVPSRKGYTFEGWYKEKQTDPDNPNTGIKIESNNKVVETKSHTLYAHWGRKTFDVTLNSDYKNVPAVDPGTTRINVKFNVVIDKIPNIPVRKYNVSFNLNDSRNSNGSTEGVSDYSASEAKWDFGGYYTNREPNKKYIDSEGNGTMPWEEEDVDTLYAEWSNGRITLPNASREGYQFLGWFTNKNAGEQRDNNYQYLETTELYAHWNPNKYKVTLDYNTNDGGSTHQNESVESFMQTFDAKFTDLFDASRNGYKFLGWFTDSGAQITKDTVATNEYGIINNNGITLHARWEKSTYTLSLDLNHQPDMTYDVLYDGSMQYVMQYDTDNNNNIAVPSVKGWTFLGWYTDNNVKVYNADGSYNREVNTFFDNSGKWHYLDSITLYAKWEQKVYSLNIDLNKYSEMSFDPSLSDGSTKYEYIMTFDSTSNNTIPVGVLDGWTFLGWYDSSNNLVYDTNGKYVESTSTEYFKNGKWNIESNLSLLAKWEQIPVTVTLQLNDADLDEKPSLSQNAYVFIYDEPITENIVIPTYPEGYEFQGWYDGDTQVFNSDGSINSGATSYFNGNKWIKNQNVTLQAKWNANGYNVSFNQSNSVNAGTRSVMATYNSALPSITVPEREYKITYNVNDSEGSTKSSSVSNTSKEWTFEGYYSDDNNQYYDENGETSIIYHESQDIELNARWSNGTIEDMPTPTRTGYTFDGWYTDTEYTTKVENGYTVTSDMELFARWIPNKYTITFDNNKATESGTTSLTVTFDEKIDNITIPSKVYIVTLDKNYDVYNRTETKEAKWTFKGYYTQANGSGTRYFDANGESNQSYTTASDITLYAYYEDGTITLPTYTRNDYIFNGWYDQETNNKAVETDTYESNKTLLLKWNSEEYNLTLNVNKPANMSSSISFTNTDYKMAMHTTTNNVVSVPQNVKGWTFLGWYDGDTQVFNEKGEYQTSATSYFDSEGNWIMKDNVSLNAHWIENVYVLSLKASESGTMNPEPTISINTYSLVYDNLGELTVSIPDYYEGYTFDGYYLGDEMIYDSSGIRVNNNSLYSSSGIVKKSSNTELVAHWTEKPNMLQLIIELIPGIEESPNLANSKYEMIKTSTTNNQVNVPSTVVGYTFLGWYDGEEKVYDSSGMYVTSSYFDEAGRWLKDTGARLTSKYVPVQSHIMLQEDELTTVSQNYYVALYKEEDPESVVIPEENGNNEFMGWYYGDTQVYDYLGNKNLNATQFFDTNGNWLYLTDVVLKAKWEKNPIKLTLDLNTEGLPSVPTVITMEYNMVLNSTNNNSINIPSEVEGYKFQGWYYGDTQVYDKNGNYNPSASTFFNSSGQWIKTSSVTLKAKWLAS